MICAECNKDLEKTTFRDGVLFSCRNPFCGLFAQRQMVEAKPRNYDFIKPPGDYGSWETYNRAHQKRKENYWFLRNHGFTPKFCKLHESTKQTDRIRKILGHHSVEYIRKQLT